MKQMNKILIILFITSIILSACDFSDNTLGGWPVRTFPISRKKMTIALNKLYRQESQYIVPDKWKDEDSAEIKGYFFLPSMTFYLKKNPEEMYFVTFIGDDATLEDTSKIAIAIRSVNNGGYAKWFRYVDESPSEQVRIERRFDDEIVSKLEIYTHTKAVKEAQ